METSRQRFNNSHYPDSWLLNDPHPITQEVHFKKQQNGLLDVEFKAWDLVISGLQGLQLENLHVVRHIGLKDIRKVFAEVPLEKLLQLAFVSKGRVLICDRNVAEGTQQISDTSQDCCSDCGRHQVLGSVQAARQGSLHAGPVRSVHAVHCRVCSVRATAAAAGFL